MTMRLSGAVMLGLSGAVRLRLSGAVRLSGDDYEVEWRVKRV